MQKIQTISKHYNVPQLRSMIVDAPIEYGIMGRATGKTTGILADKSARLLNSMPRCKGVIVAATFQQMLDRTLPPLIAGWESLGYKEGVHFIKCCKPSKEWIAKWNWLGPYHKPISYEYIICWYNGAIIQLVSQDRPGSSNGTSVDFIIGDELKLLKHDRLTNELFPANRGIRLDFKNNPHHHGMTFTSDMPIGTAGRWILNKKHDMDPVKLQQILHFETLKYNINLKILECKNRKHLSVYESQINDINYLLGFIKIGFTYYHEASTLSNLHGLGIDYIKSLIRDLSKFEFSTAILNQEPIKLEDGFYPDLKDDDVSDGGHGYLSYNYENTFDKHGYNFDKLKNLNDCRKDGDVQRGEPLHIAIDYNRRIWPIVTAQVHNISNGKQLRIVNSMDVLAPNGVKQLIDKWCEYYKGHDRHLVFFWYDHTALGGIGEPVKDEIVRYLRANGWAVIEKYIGQASEHEAKYRLIGNILRNETLWRININRDNCNLLLRSMFQTQAFETSKGFAKDKRKERDLKFPARDAPHYSDAVDTLLVGICDSTISYNNAEDYNVAQTI
jgi:hypothetical protein